MRRLKEQILKSALQALKLKIKQSQRQGHHQIRSNLELDWNIQLLAFIRLQLKTEVQWKSAELKRAPTDPITPQKSRKELALLVAQGGGWGIWVMTRILQQEVNYVRDRKLPVPKQGRHTKVASWLTDEGTKMAMQEYMSNAGEGKSL